MERNPPTLPPPARRAAATDDLEPIQEVNRLSLIQERVKRYILANGLGPGDMLPTEGQLADALRVSRSAIREAYRSLEAVGIVEARPGIGRVVRDFNFDAILNSLNYGLAFHGLSILHTHDLRKMLEFHCIEAVVAHIADADIAVLTRLVEQMRAAIPNGIVEFRRLDFEFHSHLFQCYGNPLARQLFEISWRMAEAAINSEWGYREVMPEWADDHAAILAAIARKDVAGARAATEHHFRDIEQRLRQLIAQQGRRNA